MITRKTPHAFKHGLLHARFEKLWMTHLEEDYPDEAVKEFAHHIWLALHLSNLSPLLKTGAGYPAEVEED